MRLKKNNPRSFSPWTFLGADIEAAIGNIGDETLTEPEITAILMVGIEPEALKASKKEPKAKILSSIFLHTLTWYPARAVALLALIHSRWNSQKGADVVQRWIATHFNCDTGDRACPTTAKATDDEISKAVKRSTGVTVSTSTVKKARQNMRQPKTADIRMGPQLYAALKHLKSIGFFKE